MKWLGTQWHQIRKGGLSTLARKLHVALLLTFTAIWGIPFIICIRIIRPWLHVRMGTIQSARSGHFIGDAALYLAKGQRQSTTSRTVNLFWFLEPNCNEQWARILRRQLIVRWWVRYLIALNKLIPGGVSHEVPPIIDPRNVLGRLPGASVSLQFTSKEDATAKQWLRRRGWNDGESFVCLLARDTAYLSSHPLHSESGGNHWQYHSYRDSDIGTYIDAVNALLNRGHWVIRMGNIADRPFPLRHPRMIDYPFVNDQDDLLDIWLSANCRSFITTGTGIDMIPTILLRPLIFVNLLPLTCICSYGVSITKPKHLRWKNTGRLLTLKEYLHAPYGATEEYQQAGIEIEDLSSAEITATVMESERRLEGTWVDTEDDLRRQSRFWEVFRSCPEFAKSHFNVHPEARVSNDWLKSIKDV